jgi:hypothetical protein
MDVQIDVAGTAVRPDSLLAMGRTGQIAGAVVLLLGVFWAGRERAHGLTALWEHWWCPIPLALLAPMIQPERSLVFKAAETS